MGSGPDPVWKYYERVVCVGDLRGAMRSARLHGLALDLSDMPRMTLLAARKKDDISRRMTVRWTVKMDAGGRMKLDRVGWIVARFDEAWAGEKSGAVELNHFLTKGRRR